jgi:hypothetical protein
MSHVVQAGLFSAILSTFLSGSIQSLLPNPSDTTNIYLANIQTSLQAIAAGSPSPSLIPPPDISFRPSATAIAQNLLWCSSLLLSISAAFGCLLAKQWSFSYTSGLSSVGLGTKNRLRQHRLDGVYKWKMPEIITLLPLLLHLSLLLFVVGLQLFLRELQTAIASVVLVVSCSMAAFYILTTCLSAMFSDCPYKTPLSNFIGRSSRWLLLSLITVSNWFVM